MRLFFAVPVPKKVARALSAVRGEFRKEAGMKWVPHQNLHLTLKFLGEVEEADLGSIMTLGEQAAQEVPALNLSVEGLGVFPERRRPRVLWAGITGSQSTCRDLEVLARKLGSEDFHPHLTLARFKKGKPAELVRVLDALKGQHWGSLSVRQFALVKSELLPGGPLYRELRSWDLSLR